MERNTKANKKFKTNSRRQPKPQLIPNFEVVKSGHLVPSFGEEGRIHSLVEAARRHLVPVLDDLATDPAELHHLFVKYLLKNGYKDLAKTMQCIRDMRNKIVHKDIVTLGLLRNLLPRVLAFCAWLRQEGVINAVAPSQDDVLDLEERVVSLAQVVGIMLPSQFASNAMLKPKINVPSNTNRSVPLPSFLDAGHPESFESDEEESSVSHRSEGRNNNILHEDDEDNEDDEEMKSFEEDSEDFPVPSKPVVASKPSPLLNDRQFPPITKLPASVTTLKRHKVTRAPVNPTNPSPAPSQQQAVIAGPVREVIARVPNYQSVLRNKEIRVCSGKFEGQTMLFVAPNGSNYKTRCVGELCHACTTKMDNRHALPVRTTVVEVPRSYLAQASNVVLPVPANVIQVFPQAIAPPAPAQAIPQPVQQHAQVPPIQRQQGPPAVGEANLFKLDYDQVIKGKRITLRSGRYTNSNGVFCSWNGNNWRWRCVGDLCGKCEQDEKFKHASPNDTEIEVHW